MLAGQDPKNTFSFEGLLRHLDHPDFADFEDKDQSYGVLVTPFGQLSIPKTGSKKSAVAVLPQHSYYYIYSSEINILPTLMVRGTEEFRAMDVSQRNCYYGHEKKLEQFKEYTQANCYLECTWKAAAEKCGCVPWFLSDGFPKSEVCMQEGNVCFKDTVDNRFNDGEDACGAECLDDCETLEFEVALDMVYRGGLLPECGSGRALHLYLNMLTFFLTTV